RGDGPHPADVARKVRRLRAEHVGQPKADQGDEVSLRSRRLGPAGVGGHVGGALGPVSQSTRLPQRPAAGQEISSSTRKPIVSLRKSGAYLLRRALRQRCPLLFQDPPRSTRLVPATGPVGSTSGEAA